MPIHDQLTLAAANTIPNQPPIAESAPSGNRIKLIAAGCTLKAASIAVGYVALANIWNPLGWVGIAVSAALFAVSLACDLYAVKSVKPLSDTPAEEPAPAVQTPIVEAPKPMLLLEAPKPEVTEVAAEPVPQVVEQEVKAPIVEVEEAPLEVIRNPLKQKNARDEESKNSVVKFIKNHPYISATIGAGALALGGLVMMGNGPSNALITYHNNTCPATGPVSTVIGSSNAIIPELTPLACNQVAILPSKALTSMAIATSTNCNISTAAIRAPQSAISAKPLSFGPFPSANNAVAYGNSNALMKNPVFSKALTSLPVQNNPTCAPQGTCDAPPFLPPHGINLSGPFPTENNRVMIAPSRALNTQAVYSSALTNRPVLGNPTCATQESCDAPTPAILHGIAQSGPFATEYNRIMVAPSRALNTQAVYSSALTSRPVFTEPTCEEMATCRAPALVLPHGINQSGPFATQSNRVMIAPSKALNSQAVYSSALTSSALTKSKDPICKDAEMDVCDATRLVTPFKAAPSKALVQGISFSRKLNLLAPHVPAAHIA